MQRLRIILVFVFSLILRLWITPKLDFGTDQKAIYDMGRLFYETGVVPAEGPKLVYTGESIPGGFQAVMAGLPLFFSGGEPIGLQLFIAVLNWAAMLLLFFWLRPRVKNSHQTLLAFFIAFSPWSLLFSPAWNPSFLPLLAVAFFWLLERIYVTQKLWMAFLLGLIFILCMQLHLSAVLLAIALLIVLPSMKEKLKIMSAAFVGVLVGSSFLIPWFLLKSQGQAAAPTGVLGIYWHNLFDVPKAFLRYLTFPTAEVSRFITPQGHGFRGMVGVLNAAPLLWLPAVIALVGSVVIVFWSLKYFLALAQQRKSWVGLERVEFLLPILMTFTFLFSVKGASAHTFWILMPLSFYSAVRAIGAYSDQSKLKVYGWVYLVSGLIFAVGGFCAI